MGKYQGKYLVGAETRKMVDSGEPQQQAAIPQDAPQPEAASPVPKGRVRKKSKWFKIFLGVYFLILLLVSGYLQVTLWRYLGRSQAEMDRAAAELAAQQAYQKAVHEAPQLAFDAWRSTQTTDNWTDLWYEQAPNDLDLRENVAARMAELFAPGAVTAYKAAEFTDAAPVYVLKNGETSLARVTLSGSALDWQVSSVELLVKGAYSVSITVPDGCQVLCNGTAMDAQYGQPAASRMGYEPLDGKLEGAVAWVCYSAEGLLTEPEVTVEPPRGYNLFQTEEGDYLLQMDADDVGDYTDLAVRFVRAYLNYYMSGSNNIDGNMYTVLGYLSRGTQAYDDIRETYDGVYWATNYYSIDTSKTYAGDVFFWADNCFSIDVTYDADCMLMRKKVDYADATMRIYFLRSDDQYIISNFEII